MSNPPVVLEELLLLNRERTDLFLLEETTLCSLERTSFLLQKQPKLLIGGKWLESITYPVERLSLPLLASLCWSVFQRLW